MTTKQPKDIKVLFGIPFYIPTINSPFPPEAYEDEDAPLTEEDLNNGKAQFEKFFPKTK